MLWLAEVMVGDRHHQLSRSEAYQQRKDAYDRQARQARGEVFGQAFAALGRGVRLGSRGIAVVIARYRRWRRGQLAIRDLSALNNHLLDDIGLLRSEIRDAARGSTARQSTELATSAAKVRTAVELDTPAQAELGSVAPPHADASWSRAA